MPVKPKKKHKRTATKHTKEEPPPPPSSSFPQYTQSKRNGASENASPNPRNYPPHTPPQPPHLDRKHLSFQFISPNTPHTHPPSSLPGLHGLFILNTNICVHSPLWNAHSPRWCLSPSLPFPPPLACHITFCGPTFLAKLAKKKDAPRQQHPQYEQKQRKQGQQEQSAILVSATLLPVVVLACRGE